MYIQSSIRRKLSFNLTKEEFMLFANGKCFYCGALPINTFHKTRANGDYVYNGIDRVNNKIGYEKGNCVSCCKRCNKMKETMTIKEFYTSIEQIYNWMTNDKNKPIGGKINMIGEKSSLIACHKCGGYSTEGSFYQSISGEKVFICKDCSSVGVRGSQ